MTKKIYYEIRLVISATSGGNQEEKEKQKAKRIGDQTIFDSVLEAEEHGQYYESDVDIYCHEESNDGKSKTVVKVKTVKSNI